MNDPRDAAELDLSACDREPIHLCGEIQPFGYLIVARLPDWNIAHVSSNIDEILGCPPEQLLGESLRDVFSRYAVHAFGNAVNASGSPTLVQRLFSLRVRDDLPLFDVAVHCRETRVFIEMERREDDRPMQDQLAAVQAMMGRMTSAPTLDDFYQRLAQQVRLLTFFDRVMVYRFRSDKSGEVIAEARRGDLEPFLGLRYPASDIPAQARRLYRENWVRAIGDVHYTPVAVTPTADLYGQPLDLSQVGLRSVSPVHRQYLHNMGVSASMSISLIVGGELWGLVACHNYDPIWPTLEQRMMAEMFGTFVSMQLESRLRMQAFEYERRASTALDTMIGSVSAASGLMAGLRLHTDNLRELVKADSVALFVEGEWHFDGVRLEPETCEALLRVLNAAGTEVYVTHELIRHVPAMTPYRANCAGLLSIPVSRTPRDYILLFRREVRDTVRWGGDPNKSVAPNQPLTPRNSFATYIQETDGQSEDWTDAEHIAAVRLRSALLEIVLRMSESQNEERRQFGERQAVLIAELNHRVKNLLTLIRSMVGRSRQGVESLDQFIENLHGRITALSLAHDQLIPGRDRLPELGNLVIAEVSPFRPASFGLHVEGPAVGLEPITHTSLALVLHELATNAAKYGAFRQPGGRLEVSWSLNAQRDCELRWLESGVSGVQPPEHHGFGSTLIERTVPFELGGDTRVSYEPDGVKIAIRIPQSYVVPLARQRTDQDVRSYTEQDEEPAEAGALPDSITVLVVEDNVLIAMEMEDMLHELGVARVEVCNGVTQARRVLAAQDIDVAVLDVNLGNETSLPVADELVADSRPVVFATAYNDHLMIPERLRGVPVVRKPTSARRLAEAIQVALAT